MFATEMKIKIDNLNCLKMQNSGIEQIPFEIFAVNLNFSSDDIQTLLYLFVIRSNEIDKVQTSTNFIVYFYLFKVINSLKC